MKLVIVLFTLFLVFSCSDMRKGSQIEQISELQSNVDQIKTAWNSLELKSIDSIHQICSTVIDSIELYYNDQEVDKAEALLLDEYKQGWIKFLEMKKIHSFMPTLLSEKAKALSSLKSDIEKGSGRREKYDEYIAFEQQEVATINEQYENYLALKQAAYQQFETTKADVESFLAELKSEKWNGQNK